MSLKCSLLGHRFDETAVEHDRQEDGSEVVIVSTELETCSRCGETRVVSENKEVKSMGTPASTGTEPVGGPGDGSAGSPGGGDAAATDDAAAPGDATDAAENAGQADASAGAEATPGPDAADADAVGDAPAAEAGGADAGGDDAEILGSGPAADDPETDAQVRARTDSTPIPDAEGEAADPADAADGAVPDDADDGAVTDDAVIIDGDTGTEREPGEWPEDADGEASAAADAEETGAGATDDGEASPRVTEAVDGDDAAVWTGDDAGRDDAADADAANADDAGRNDAADADAANADDAGRNDAADADWPAEDDASPDPVGGEWPEETTRDDPTDDGGPTLERSASPTVTVPEGMYKCAECGFTTEVESSSLRAGDFCPECRTGTLVQHEDDE